MHYLKVILAQIAINSKVYLENRWNAFGSIVNSLISLILLIVFINIYFTYTKDIAGWDKYQVFLVGGLFRTSFSLFYIFFLRSINWIPRYVQKGTLDLFLTKPVPSQLVISFRLIRVPEVLPVLGGLILVYYSVINLGGFSIVHWIALLVGLLLGNIIMYGIYFSLATLSIFMGRFAGLTDIFYIIREPLAYPVDFLGKNVSLILTFIVPLGFIVTIPASLFLGKSPVWFLGLAIFFAGISLGFSIWFWNFALKHYTSASS